LPVELRWQRQSSSQQSENFGEKAGFEWSFFTLTRRLHLMVSRLGIAPTLLGEGDSRRIADSERWGTYTLASPNYTPSPADV